MTAPTDSDLWIGWEEYHRLIERLCWKIHVSGWRFDGILCLARGGLRVGDVMSRIFEKPLAILSTSSYRADGGTVQGTLDIAQHITMPRDELGGRVLLVDDLVDSGLTLERVAAHLRQSYGRIDEVRSAVIWYKGCSGFKPDYFVEYLPNSPWIHQPFEEYDNVRPEQLGAGAGSDGRDS